MKAKLFHNRLMKMCQVSYASFVEAAAKRAEKKGRLPHARVQQPVKQEHHEGVVPPGSPAEKGPGE